MRYLAPTLTGRAADGAAGARPDRRHAVASRTCRAAAALRRRRPVRDNRRCVTSAELNRRELERYLERVTDRWPVQRALLGGARVDDSSGAPPQRERGPEYVLVLVSEHFDGVPWLERVYQAGQPVGRARDGRAPPRCTATRRRSSSASASSSRSCARPPSTGSSCCPSPRDAPLFVRSRAVKWRLARALPIERLMSRLSRLLTTFALLVAAAALTASPALARKHDHDRMPDRWEKRYHLNVKKDDSRRDRDRDGLSNYGEYRAHTEPAQEGLRPRRPPRRPRGLRPRQAAQRAEIRTGFDPGDEDSDDDGVKDGRENAGKIVEAERQLRSRSSSPSAARSPRGSATTWSSTAAARAQAQASDPGRGHARARRGRAGSRRGRRARRRRRAARRGDDATGDAPTPSRPEEDGEDDEPFDDAAFDQAVRATTPLAGTARATPRS